MRRPADERRFGRAVILFFLKLAIWKYDRIVRDGTHAHYYDSRCVP